MILKVELNGTTRNPYHVYGLSQNPFPQIAEYGRSGDILALQSLGGDPIPNTDYIREKLKNWSDEFVDLLCKKFVKGEYVEFTVRIPDVT